MNRLVILSVLILLLGCATQGEIEYITSKGQLKTGCETEYRGAPSVDKYAVEYVLSYCAKGAEKQGFKVVDRRLLTLDLFIPKHPSGDAWSFELATKLYQLGQLTDKEYGYIIAFVDLGLNNSSQ